MKNVVYSITCPITNDLMYIGSTKNLKARQNRHLSNPFGKMHTKMHYLIDNKQKHIFKVLVECERREDAYIKEKELIKSLKPIYNTIYNGNSDNTAPSTYMVDSYLVPNIKVMLSKDKISGNVKYSSISDFVNQAIKEKLAKEAKK